MGLLDEVAAWRSRRNLSTADSLCVRAARWDMIAPYLFQSLEGVVSFHLVKRGKRSLRQNNA
ncbi:hypothetical protein P4B35_14355 [Pontiellaceae bacterium B12227]|nr:hypothetical protein [Pontiellaceae bacterium B12227]